MRLKDEVNRRNSFETGIPVNYNDGKNEYSGEVVERENGIRKIAIYKKGQAGFSGSEIIPKTWFNVRKFNSDEKKYTKKHKNRDAMDKHIEKIINRNGAFSINGQELIYWF